VHAYRLLRPLIFAASAQRAHEMMTRALALADRSRLALVAARRMARSFPARPLRCGGVDLPHPFILAAGLVKGTGFDGESAALAAVERGENVIPGWRSMPALVGPVEFGSFTRHPRLGNPGTVVWRHAATRSTQNRVGLRNPGARAAAAFLGARRAELPAVFGISIASSPGVSDAEKDRQELVEAFGGFVDGGVRPTWFALNLSCPNTDDEPALRQTEAATAATCAAVLGALRGAEVPLWVKIGPGLADAQYRMLLRVLSESGVRAIIATNTVARPSPGDPNAMAGVGGRDLHPLAVHAIGVLADEKRRLGASIDLIGSGGVDDAASYADFSAHGVAAVQYWSALIYRGPLAAAQILAELDEGAPAPARGAAEVPSRARGR
jgi:dihydroorotate dehydrogenase